MTAEQKKTCETCRYVSYTRFAERGVTQIQCENPELMQKTQMAELDAYVEDTGKFIKGPEIERFFHPPRLAFSCNRWLMRKPELGFPPDFVREEEKQEEEQERLRRLEVSTALMGGRSPYGGLE